MYIGATWTSYCDNNATGNKMRLSRLWSDYIEAGLFFLCLSYSTALPVF